MRIQHNIMAMNAYRNYNNNTSALSKNLEKLSSGYKINRAGDDAAGLAISEKMRAQITGLDVAQKNAKDGISLVQTAEGALTEVHDMLNRMVELANQSANGTYDNATDRAQLQKEMDQLRTEIDRIADSSNFNGIKLLDGSLGASTESISADSSAGVVDGIELGTVAPGGTNGSYTIDLNNTFGAGSQLKITFGTGDPTNNGVNTVLTTGMDGGADANSGSITLDYGTDFTGLTREEQAASIAEFLNANADIAGQFDITASGTSVVLTNKNEGNKEITVTAAQITDTNNIATGGATTNQQKTAAVAGGTLAEFVLADLFDPGKGYDFEKGDVISLSFEDQQGNTWKASITLDALGASDTDTHTTILNALKNATFEDVEGTLGDESTKKVSDLFNVTLESGTTTTTGNFNLKLAGNAGTEIFAGKDVTVSVQRDGVEINPKDTSVKTVTEGKAAAGTAEVYEFGLNTGTESNFSVGDKITLKGQLSDGTAFEVTLEAGKDFELDENSYANTLTNIQQVLSGARGYNAVDVTLGKGTDNERTVSSKELFDTDGTSAEIKVGITGNNLEFTSNVKSNALNSKVTGVTVEAAPIAKTTNLFVNGNQQTGAGSTITFEDGKIAEGATVTVGDKTYEFTTTGNLVDPDSGHIAVQVSDLNDGAALANALKDAIQAQIQADVDATYTVGVSTNNPNQVVITTKAVGTTAEPIKVSAANAGTQSALEFTLDPEKVSDGTQVTIEGQTYEIVSKENRATTNKDGTKKYNVVVVDNLNDVNGPSAADLANALKEAVDANQNKGDIDMTVDTDGKITIKGTKQTPDDNGSYVYNTPKDITINYQGGLTLQIGDTADSYNQLKVEINDCHTTSMIDKETNMSIADVKISDQKSAQEAVDVIKAAINYVSDVRGTLGATQNRLDHTINNLSVMQENIQDAESTIRDTDVADEMMAYTKNNILIQSAQAMLAQANQVPQGVLQLLQ